MAQTKREVYMFKSMEELLKGVDTPVSNNKRMTNQSAKMLIESADNILKEGRRSYEVGDEEKAFILYMRACELYMNVKKHKEYKTDQRYFESMIRSGILESMERAESLKASLKERYDLIKLASQSEVKQKQKEIEDALRQQEESKKKQQQQATKINGVIKPLTGQNEEKTNSEKERGLSPQQLKNLIEQQSTRILVIDCRGGHDYQSSHLQHSNCISIPQEILLPGMTANKIGMSLKDKHPESYHHWNKRSNFDKVILYDWNSSYENMHENIDTLYKAMTQWDLDTTYPSPPAILQGGMKNLLYTYPTLINHPSNTREGLKPYEENGNHAGVPKQEKPLSSISYPNLDDDDRQSRKVTPPPGTSNVAGLVQKFSGNNNTIPPPATSSNMAFDRTKKPNVRIIPIHIEGENGKIVNGHSSPPPNNLTPNDVAETKAAALKAALDDAIITSKELKKREQEIDNMFDLETENELEAIMNKLKLKEKEIENLQDVIKNKDENLKILQADYDSAIANKSKPSLPQIRPNANQTMIDNKLKEKRDLDDYVRLLRAKRKEKEQKAVENNTNNMNNRLPTIPGSGSSSPRPISRVRSGKSESSAVGPATNFHPSTIPNGPEAKSSQSGSSLLRPMSQDATSAVSYQKLKDDSSGDSPRSLLKRSHSHPNIAQSLSEEDTYSPSEMINSSPQVPQFNRSLKPSTSRPAEFVIPSRARQFHAVNSTEKQRTGLKNLGNTCYMNSIVQCLYHIPGLVDYFQSEKWKEHLQLHRKQKHPTNGEISAEFHAVMQEMSYGHRSIAIMDLKNIVGKHHQSFRGYEQQDSHEFLTILLDWLHEELNQMSKSPMIEQQNDGISDTDAANKAWKMYKTSNSSRIADLFCGQQKSAVRCLSCGKESVTFEPFFNLSVPIPSTTNRRVDIYQCIDLYTTEEHVSGWNCPHCKSTVKATKKIDLWKLPPYLIIHFQRFYNDGWWKKRLTEVEFPVDNLDLTDRVKGRTQEARSPKSSFMLQAVSNHYGSMDGGHYTAYCRRHGLFAKFDDQEVSQINPRDVVTPAAYILFYCNNSP